MGTSDNLSSEYFNTRLNSITPKKGQVAAAIEVRRKIEKRLLAAKNDKEKTKFHFYRTKNFGSFSKGIAINEKSDIDILALFNLEALLHGKTILNSKTFLRKVKGILVESEFAQDIKIKGPSIVATIDGLKVDIVPGTFYGKHKRSNLYYIPDFNDGWMVTDPDFRNTILNQENAKSINRLKKTIKLIKYWAHNNKRAKYLSSFYLETVLTDPKNNLKANNLNNFLIIAFRILKNRQGNSINDPHLLNSSLIPISYNENKRIVVTKEIDKAYEILTTANKLCIKGQHKEAVQKWRKVFG